MKTLLVNKLADFLAFLFGKLKPYKIETHNKKVIVNETSMQLLKVQHCHRLHINPGNPMYDDYQKAAIERDVTRAIGQECMKYVEISETQLDRRTKEFKYVCYLAIPKK